MVEKAQSVEWTLLVSREAEPEAGDKRARTFLCPELQARAREREAQRERWSGETCKDQEKMC